MPDAKDFKYGITLRFMYFNSLGEEQKTAFEWFPLTILKNCKTPFDLAMKLRRKKKLPSTKRGEWECAFLMELCDKCFGEDTLGKVFLIMPTY